MTRIAYGKPSPPMRERAERGEIILGGCCVNDSLRWGCIPCMARKADEQHRADMEKLISRYQDRHVTRSQEPDSTR
ncbi:hypothetical protein ACWZHB_24985 [Nocardia sp. FBN12]|uniref:hypothetical protein n=1 Tax=Nocardia sp. FBN12 TaxID=3419766 RepID=UPI003D072767